MSDELERPKLDSVQRNSITLRVPTGWCATIAAVSKRGYHHLVCMDYCDFSKVETKYLANDWTTPGSAMHDIDTDGNEVLFAPQEGDATLIFHFYYSEQVEHLSVRDIDRNKYASHKLQTLVDNKPSNAPIDVPDYSLVFIHVEDAPDDQTIGEQPSDDLILTIRMVNNNTPQPVETGTQGMTEQGKQAIQDFLNRYIRPGEPYPAPPPPYEPTPELARLPVCIIGAGVSGLYIAMMLDKLGIIYQIMEGSERIGGRLYTYRFPNRSGKYQYYDVGAMRYPRTTFMKRTFDLVEKRLEMPNAFIPYIRSNKNAFLCYNDITVRKAVNEQTPKSKDVFKVSQTNGGNVPHEYVAKGSDAMWSEALKELRDNFKDMKFVDAYKELMKFEGYSVAGYLQQVKGYSIDVINWFQTAESRTGLMDEALTETVLASLVFDDPKFEGKKIEWNCLDGGSEVVPTAMTEKISSKPVLYQRATAIEESDNGDSITVTFDDGRRNRNGGAPNIIKRKYSNVISTMSFACLRMVDLRKAGLNYGQKNAIRDLMYTPSIKVGMQFKTAWWERLGIIGGQSSTDLPIRDVVYPSYGPDTSHRTTGEKSNCMIASYNGMQDAQRLGGLMHGRGSDEERVMLDLIMRNLAQLHNVDVQTLWEEFEDYHPWDFYRDSFQLGAFCQFGPGQFKYVYPFLQQPASSKQRIHFAGDATSSFHGWVAGALNSGWRAVMGMLIAHPELNPNKDEDIIKKFQDIWGKSEELDDDTLAQVVNLGRTMPRSQ
ncbi:FAD/NAD(P)-binding domain-containing protein [Phlegmacium glaucopus]|nr:FAD/NAD(P)-binding domain-containing protein [Phlegmacium glaucopus]